MSGPGCGYRRTYARTVSVSSTPPPSRPRGLVLVCRGDVERPLVGTCEWPWCHWIWTHWTRSGLGVIGPVKGLQAQWYGSGTHVASPQCMDVLLSTFVSPVPVEGRCLWFKRSQIPNCVSDIQFGIQYPISTSCAFPVVGATTLTTQVTMSRR